MSEISSRDCDLTESKRESMNYRDSDSGDPLENVEVNANVEQDFDNLEIPDKVPDDYQRPKPAVDSDSDDDDFGHDRSGSISDQGDHYGQVYTTEDLESYKRQIEKAIDLQF